MEKRTPKTREEATQYAIDWQYWASEQNPIGAKADKCKLYQIDMIVWQGIFEELADKFDLNEEFRENGII